MQKLLFASIVALLMCEIMTNYVISNPHIDYVELVLGIFAGVISAKIIFKKIKLRGRNE